MYVPGGSRRQVYFGEFQLDLDTAELRNNGNKSSLVGQPLQILTELLERPGELVTRQELKKKLWPDDTFVDFDQSLNKAVNRLREALKDSAEHPRFIETLPRRGYRFIGSLNTPVGIVLETRKEQSAQAAGREPTARSRLFKGRAMRVLAMVAAVLGLSALLLVLGHRFAPPAMPRVTGSTRLTNDGRRKFALVTDGVRLYFSEGGTIVQSSVDGGQEIEIRTGLSDVDLYDISPHGSALLVGAGVQGSPTVERPVWIVSLPAGTPIQVGNIKALWASWAPDGEDLAYTTNNGVYAAKKDGTEIRKLANVPGTPWKLQYSPDGSRIRFDAPDTTRNLASIWEITADGKNIRLLFPELNKPLHTGAWSADGKYFFFNSHEPEKDRDEDIWVSSELGISRDGQWVAYVSYPELTLWRSKVDGTQRLQLTFPPLQVVTPRWSPDGSRIAFTDVSPGKTWKVYVISSSGGAPQEIIPGDTRPEIDPSWCPDGNSIVFGGSVGDAKRSIRRVDLKTHAVSTLTGSEALLCPQLSPDGRYVSALPTDASKLMLYDFKTGQWQQKGGGIFQFNTWSPDGTRIYLLDISGVSQIVRFDVAGKNFEAVVSLKDVEQGARDWVGLDEAENPMLVLDKSITDVYRLDLRIP